MNVITEPSQDTRAVRHLTADMPLFTGEGQTNYVCGNCATILLKQMSEDPYMSVAFNRLFI
jgi:hypothetical protein